LSSSCRLKYRDAYKIGNPEKLVTRRGNQKWTIQRNWQHEGEIKNGKSRETGNAKGQSKMDNPEKLATRRGNQKLPIFDCPLFIIMNLIQTFTYFLIEIFLNYLI
jgi:hypothetical protein